MMRKRVFALALLCVALLCASSLKTGAARKTINEGDAVSLRLKGLDGQTYDLEKMRGRVQLVSFGATWCQPCVAELRALEELKQEYKTKPVKIFWVNIEGMDELSDEELRAYAKRQKLTLPVLRDTGKLTYAQFSTRVRIPLVVFFDKNGRVAGPIQFGMATPENYKSFVRGRLDKLLAEQAGGSQ